MPALLRTIDEFNAVRRLPNETNNPPPLAAVLPSIKVALTEIVEVDPNIRKIRLQKEMSFD